MFTNVKEWFCDPLFASDYVDAKQQKNIDYQSLLLFSYAYRSQMFYPAKKLNKEEHILKAIKKNSVDIVMYLLRRGADIHTHDEKGRTLLMLTNNDEIISFLIKRGLDINAQDKTFRTALHYWASYPDGDQIISKYSKLFTKYDVKDKLGNTPLHYAAQSKHNKNVTCLIQLGHKLDIQNNKMETALFFAVSNNEFDNFNTLIENGANANILDEFGRNPLFYVREEKYFPILLSSGADVNISDKNGQTPIFHVQFKFINVLVKKGADINHQDKYGNTVLHKLMQSNPNDQSRMIELIKMGAKVGIKNKNGNTLAQLVAKNELDKVAKCIINNTNFPLRMDLGKVFQKDEIYSVNDFEKFVKNGSDMYVKVYDSDINVTLSLIFYIIFSPGYRSDKEVYQCIKILLQNGHNPNYSMPYYSVLSFAIEHDKYSIAKLLLQYKADINFGNGLSPLTRAALDYNFFQYLIQNGADISAQPVKLLAAAAGNGIDGMEVILYLYKKGYKYEYKPIDDDNPIFNSISWEITSFFLNHGVDKNCKDSQGFTLLHHIAKNVGFSQDSYHLKQVIKLGLDVNAKNKFGRTPLFYTIADRLAVAFETLLRNGANIYARDNDGNTVFDMAIRKKNIRNVLIDYGYKIPPKWMID